MSIEQPAQNKWWHLQLSRYEMSCLWQSLHIIAFYCTMQNVCLKIVIKPNVSFLILNKHTFVISITTIYLDWKTAIFWSRRWLETLRKKSENTGGGDWWLVCADKVIPLVVDMSMDTIRECDKLVQNVCKNLQRHILISWIDSWKCNIWVFGLVSC